MLTDTTSSRMVIVIAEIVGNYQENTSMQRKQTLNLMLHFLMLVLVNALSKVCSIVGLTQGMLTVMALKRIGTWVFLALGSNMVTWLVPMSLLQQAGNLCMCWAKLGEICGKEISTPALSSSSCKLKEHRIWNEKTRTEENTAKVVAT